MVWDTVDTGGARRRMSVTIPSQFVQTCQFFILPLSFRTKLSTTALKNTEIPDFFFLKKVFYENLIRTKVIFLFFEKGPCKVQLTGYDIQLSNLILLETVKPLL